MYNFDKIIDRENTANVKYDLRQAYFGNANVLPMWVADMDFETPEFIRKAIRERANHPIYGYTFRTDEYYQSIIDWQKRRINWSIKKEWIMFSPGVVPAFNFAIQAFTGLGDGIIIQPPVYFPFFNAVDNNNRKQVLNQLKLKNGEYTIDFDDLEQKAAAAKMILLSNPHNPVGRCWTAGELKKLGEICIKHNVIILSDEIHSDLILPGFKHTAMASISEEIASNTVTCFAPSKTFNLAGLASSSVVISDEGLRNRFQKVLEQLHITNGNLFGVIASQAGYLHGDEWLDELMIYIEGNYNLLKTAIDSDFKTLNLLPLEATYLAWIDFSGTGLNDDEIKDKLVNNAGIGLSHGPVFGKGGEGFQRINLAAPRSKVDEAVRRLKTVFA